MYNPQCRITMIMSNGEYVKLKYVPAPTGIIRAIESCPWRGVWGEGV